MHTGQLAQCLVCRARVTWTVSWWCLWVGSVLRVKISTPNMLIFIYTTKPVLSIPGNLSKGIHAQHLLFGASPSLIAGCLGPSTGTASGLVQAVSLQHLPLRSAGPYPGATLLLLQFPIPESA